MSCSSLSRQKGNEYFNSAAVGVALVVRLDRYQKALSYYHKASNNATNDHEQASACKNILICTHYITKILMERNDIDQCLFYFKECLTHGNKAITAGLTSMSQEWTNTVQARVDCAFSEVFDLICSMKHERRVRILHRFSSIPESKEQRVKMLQQLVKEYFHASVIALENKDYKGSLNVLTEMYTPLTTLEELASDDTYEDDILLEDFISNMKEDVFKNRCISESMQKRLIADRLLHTTINDADDLNVAAIWQVIDLYMESILLTRENDVEQEAISLSKLGAVYHKVLLQKGRAKEVFLRVIQLAQSLQPRNLSKEEWYKDASTILAEYQIEQLRKEEREWEKSRQRYLDAMKTNLSILKRNMTELSIQKLLVWLYTEHPPKHCNMFIVDLKQIERAPGDAVKKLLAKAIVFYHPDKIQSKDHGMEYKVFCEEIVKYLTAKYEQMKGC